MYQIIHVLINSNASFLVKQCKVSANSMVYSDDNSLEITLRLLFNKILQNPRCQINFNKFMDNKTEVLFNKNLKIKVDDCADLGYNENCRHMSDSDK